MALINVLKIGSDGLQAEHDPAADELNMLDYQLGSVSLSGTSGATVLGDDDTAYTNFTPSGNSIRDTFLAIDTAIGNLDFSDCVDYTFAETATLGQVVYVSGNDSVSIADSSDNAKDNPIGIAGQAVTATNTGKVCYDGVVVGALSGATAGDKYFLSTAGAMSTTPPGSGNNVVLMGYAKNATDIHLQIQNIGKRL